jgi:uncharacterized protein YndB with AHSA1/START domain
MSNGNVRSIEVEEVLPHAPQTVWRTLTESELIARWLMPNTFTPAAGQHFTFQTQPMGNWDGVVQCEILEIDPPKKLVYSWKGGTADNADYGAPLDSIVTWTLTPVDGGTRVQFSHSGFRSPGNDFAFKAMGDGWSRIMRGIDRVAGEIRTAA